ncbi:cryptochrome/photolyase family protein [Oscillatoria sp. FACHB-1407]|uniref:cryptochrome/photolyase family protein n=1 Tax=Oscillatoria sp. FACHB-1407 TaxID=2692847 RepID=UPI001687BA39|nr:cryptochrome/photolyase family protein [Oscillatoria sp. FACHB-1407]MBD2461296.1 cryptochrome/photolyase family protein [Oscillatoria sp. FACHB-1407]
MTTGVWVLGDQLWAEQTALQSCLLQQSQTPVLFIESLHHAQKLPYHLQKLVLVWSAMRHFAEELRQAGWAVTYVQAPDFKTLLLDWIQQYQISELRVMTPTDRPFAQLIQQLNLPCAVTFTPSNRFIWQDEEFKQWASQRKRLVMEDFYREGRQRFNILMVGDQPAGGRWNFDRENRKPPKGKLTLPEALWFEPDAITQDVIDWVKQSPACKDSQEYWQIEPFRWGVTRSQALQVLDFFVETRLSEFGPYQDAMVTGEQTMWHAMLSPYLNLGLLHPLEVVQAAERAYLQHQSEWELNSVEGFIRQVLGWREYMHGIYIYMGEDYPERNWFNHTQPLPNFYWTGDTQMNCLHQILTQVKETGYAHHIQRLMVLNNFALIAGISPQETEDWFHAAFIDAYDWVMQTNVIGMGQFADGGMMASKPYAASANYINNMSDYCKGCTYKPRDRSGDNACPFNFFYWDFLARHYDKLKKNHRMFQILRNLERISPEELQVIRQKAAEWHGKEGGGKKEERKEKG